MKKRLTKQSLNLLTEELKKGRQTVLMNCPGGEWMASMKFVEKIKELGLEKNLAFKVQYSNSAATFILLALANCERTLEPNGLISVHGGMIKAELNVVVLGGLIPELLKYYSWIMELINPLISPDRMQIFRDTNHLDLTIEEIRKAGITVLEPSGSPG